MSWERSSQLYQERLRRNIEKNMDLISDIFCIYNDDKKVLETLMGEVFQKTNPEIYFQSEYPIEDKIKSAIAFTLKKHKGQYRDSGLPYAVHPVQNGYIVAEFRSSINTVVTSLLHDVLEENSDNIMNTANEIMIRFGQNTYSAILEQSIFDDGVERDKTLADNLWFRYWHSHGDGMFRSKCADGISNLYTKEHMKPKNGMTREERIKKFCMNAKTKLLPMAKVLDAKGNIDLNVAEYITHLIYR